MKDIFDGDLRLFLDDEGADIRYIGGQPIMDRGLKTTTFVSLFTERTGEHSNQKGYWGNLLSDDPETSIGSDYVANVRNQPITLKKLAQLEQNAGKALNAPVFGAVESTVSNPTANRLDITILIKAPADTFNLLLQTANGLNWVLEAEGDAELPAPVLPGKSYYIPYMILTDQGYAILTDLGNKILGQ